MKSNHPLFQFQNDGMEQINLGVLRTNSQKKPIKNKIVDISDPNPQTESGNKIKNDSFQINDRSSYHNKKIRNKANNSSIPQVSQNEKVQNNKIKINKQEQKQQQQQQQILHKTRLSSAKFRRSTKLSTPQVQQTIKKQISQKQKQEQSKPKKQQRLKTFNDQQYGDKQHQQNSKIVKIKLSETDDIKSFLETTIKKGDVLQCTVNRNKSWLGATQYSLYTTDKSLHLMSSKKQFGNKTSNYLITMDKKQMKKGDNYLGKIRGNWISNQFIGYDNGCNPEKKLPGQKQRKTLIQIHHSTNLFKKNAVSIKVYGSQNPTVLKNKQSLKQIHKRKGQTFCLVNKIPKYNQTTQTYSLNFNQRVNQGSSKNFILIDQNEKSQSNTSYSLLFGKVRQDVFHLDIKYPLSPLQGFQIMLSVFDFK